MRGWLAAAGINGIIAVAMGAVGAHVLAGRLDPHALDLVAMAARYQMYHALALFGVAWLATLRPGELVRAAGFAFLFGVVCFSGGLYAHALTGWSGFAFPVPVGGTAFMFGWLLLLLVAVRR